MSAATLMVQGTASNVGKSLLVTALCRIFRDRGLRVAPFKAMNMALNSAVTKEGFEIGRAQALQALAAGVEARVEMNPILLKPEPGGRAQLVLMGEVAGRHDFLADGGRREELAEAVETSLRTLRAEHDLVIIEGAGSPAEVNLRSRDIANMHVAELADAPVLLVGDIDRGGVFASLLGTLDLLEADERARVRGLVINKFRGEPRLLEPGVRILEDRGGVPVVGVLPFLRDLGLADEDGVDLESRRASARAEADVLEVAILRFPSISNHDEFLPLEREAGVVVRYVESARELEGADLVIVPGSKSTLDDLAWLRARRMQGALLRRVESRSPILAICGGCQMLGERIDDLEGVEGSQGSVAGLGLLPITTRFEGAKHTARVQLSVPAGSFLGAPAGTMEGYEIHMGRAHASEGASPATLISSRNSRPAQARDGARSANGALVGTMVHGLFENESLRASMLKQLRIRAGLPELPDLKKPRAEDPIERLAREVEQALNMNAIEEMIGAQHG